MTTSCWKSLPGQHFSERWPCLLNLISRAFDNHATMTLPSYGHELIATDLSINKDRDYAYGGLMRLDNGLNLYNNQAILQGLGTYYRKEDIKYLELDKKLKIWTVPR